VWYARAPKGERAYGQAPRNWGKNIALIASLSAEGIEAAMSVERTAFETYVEHSLDPTLKERQIVVMDNLQVHKSARVREPVKGVGAEILFLPPYQPHFSPIEETFSKVKGVLRRIGACSWEALIETTGQALDAVSRRDALSWLVNCGNDVVHHSL
jgi:transposase